MQQIEQAILEAVEDIYQKKYIGRLKVIKNPTNMLLKMWFNLDYEHMLLAKDTTDECEFLEFIKKELRSKQLNLVKYFEGYKYEPEDQCTINNTCNHNDNIGTYR